jgi:hypothetical protein
MGPQFFNIFVNDVTSLIKHSNAYLFVDDLKLTRTVKDPTDALKLQEDVTSLADWCTSNKMCLNPMKCNHIKFQRKRNELQTNYKILDQPVEEVDMIKDLGVTLDSKLRFNKHIDTMLDAAFRALRFVIRCGKAFKKLSTLTNLFNGFVRSKLEYYSDRIVLVR